MKLAAPVKGHRLRFWQTFCVAALAAAPVGARGELWTVDNSFDSRIESNDNILLAQKSPGTVNTLSISSALNASRQSESTATRVSAAAAVVREQGVGGEDRVDGHFGVTQSLKDSLNQFNVSALYEQDFNNVVQNADVTLGPGRRRTTTGSASWSHSLSERLSESTQLSFVRAGYGQQLSGAEDYSDASGTASLSYRLSELDSLSIQVGHSDYRTQAGSNRSTTDDISVGASRSFSERSSGSLNIGTNRTRSSIKAFGLACPLAVAYCNAGLVAPVVFEADQNSTAQGLQYSTSWVYQLDERTGFSFAAARQQTPSGIGAVVQNDSLTAVITRNFSEKLNGSINYAQSRSTLEFAGGGRVGQRSLTVVLSRQLTSDLSVASTYQRTDADPVAFGGRAHSNSISVSLKYAWPQSEATH